jgi:ABC-type bacteriocin/lantibiotic exporter with double-glycine peptidase domain
MTSRNSVLTLLKVIWTCLSIPRQRQLALLVGLMVLASFAEALSIGAIIPFLGVMTNPEKVLSNNTINYFLGFFGFQSSLGALFLFTGIFCVAAIISSSLRLLLLWASTKLSFLTGADISSEVYRRTLYQPYSIHTSRNTSEIISGIATKTNSVISQTIMPIMTVLTSVIVLFVILSALFLLNPLGTLLATTFFSTLYFIIFRITKKNLKENGVLIARESTNIIKILQEGLGGIRDVLIDGNQEIYCRVYKKSNSILLKASAANLFVAGSPKFLMEAFGMIAIASFTCVLVWREGGLDSAIPILGAFALGAQRVLPMLQQLYYAISAIKSNQETLSEVVLFLEQPIPDIDSKKVEPMPFISEISLVNASFRYNSTSDWILKDINLNISKGSKVGITGITGGGKSTLVDIFMGLLSPTVGSLMVDSININNRNCLSWQSNIAHVPQSIYLTDATIAENIAFGVEKSDIDYQRVKQVASKAKISETIDSWEFGYETIVGERGVRLSGGQRQRIGIARALYKRASVLILDEATSALDDLTEAAVMSEINSLDKDITILMVAHRVTTLRSCDMILDLTDGVLTKTYKLDG